MAIKIKLFQNKDSRKEYKGKWYGRVVRGTELHTKDLARSISESNSVTESDVVAVITALVEEMKYRLQSGHTVVLDDFGRFHLAVKSEMVDTPDDYNVGKHVKEVCCKFTPAGHRDPLTRHVERDFCKGVVVKKD